jgi:hypothetical protein
MAARDHHVRRVRVTGEEGAHHEGDRGHDPADGVGRPLGHKHRADNREGTEPYKKQRVLHRAVARQTGAVLEHKARADARDAKGKDQPPHHTRKCVTLYPSYSSSLFSCPFCHSTTLQHDRL